MTSEMFTALVREVGEMNAKLDILVEGHKGHEPRIRDLELFKAKALGIWLVVTAVVGFLASQVPSLVSFALASGGTK